MKPAALADLPWTITAKIHIWEDSLLLTREILFRKDIIQSEASSLTSKFGTEII
jgi:hypothetical protein